MKVRAVSELVGAKNTNVNRSERTIKEDRLGVPVPVSLSEQALRSGYLDYDMMCSFAEHMGFGRQQGHRAYWASIYDLGHHEALSGPECITTFTGHDFPLEIVHTSETFPDAQGADRPMDRETYLQQGGNPEDLTNEQMWMVGLASLRLFVNRMWTPSQRHGDGPRPGSFDKQDYLALDGMLAVSPRTPEVWTGEFAPNLQYKLNQFQEARAAGERYSPKLYARLAERADLLLRAA